VPTPRIDNPLQSLASVMSYEIVTTSDNDLEMAQPNSPKIHDERIGCLPEGDQRSRLDGNPVGSIRRAVPGHDQVGQAENAGPVLVEQIRVGG